MHFLIRKPRQTHTQILIFLPPAAGHFIPPHQLHTSRYQSEFKQEPPTQFEAAAMSMGSAALVRARWARRAAPAGTTALAFRFPYSGE